MRSIYEQQTMKKYWPIDRTLSHRRRLHRSSSRHWAGAGCRDVVAFLPQELGLYRELTVKDYLAYAAVLKGLPRRESRRRICELRGCL